jgi:hypothetical protein
MRTLGGLRTSPVAVQLLDYASKGAFLTDPAHSLGMPR